MDAHTYTQKYIEQHKKISQLSKRKQQSRQGEKWSVCLPWGKCWPLPVLLAPLMESRPWNASWLHKIHNQDTHTHAHQHLNLNFRWSNHIMKNSPQILFTGKKQEPQLLLCRDEQICSRWHRIWEHLLWTEDHLKPGCKKNQKIINVTEDDRRWELTQEEIGCHSVHGRVCELYQRFSQRRLQRWTQYKKSYANDAVRP